MEVKVLAIEALESGLSASEIGELVGVGAGTIHKWRKDYAAASVFIESILEQYDDHNVLRFSDEEIRRLRELAAEVESQGRRRSRRQSGHLGVGSESRYRVS
jgi:hypothetical protein